ncbi:hypothetical protein BJ742DRAFT_796017 [Cladochytrium replicatum]|nr:hypothetical protein BJ742DRAFT_796017 [Cladochytrium replicatum]
MSTTTTARYRPIGDHPPTYGGRFISVTLLVLGVTSVVLFWGSRSHPPVSAKGVCPQGDKIFPPVVPSLQAILAEFETVEYRNHSADIFGKSLTYATESFDDMRANGAPPEDPRYLPFKAFHKYLEDAFPLVHKNLKREFVNHHSLLYTWQGSDKFSRPMMLEAHLDVVPVNQNTWHEWTHPPYSGFFDGQFIWGRGAGDTKNSLIAILEAVEALIKGGFRPTKTILIAFGHDEEIGGLGGAASIASTLLERYGPKSIEFIVDEGYTVIPDGDNLLAPVGTQEKGYVDIRVKVDVPGGHSSVPPDHTGIGIISRIVTAFEDHPFPITVTKNNALLTSLQCLVENDGKIDPELANALSDIEKNNEPLKQLLLKGGPEAKYSLTTSQAIDVINGGVKANALPESTFFIVNHRIQIDWSIQKVVERHLSLVQPIASQFDLAVQVVFADNSANTFLTYRGSRVTKEKAAKLAFGTVTIEVMPANSEPMPATSLRTEAWKLLSGTIRAVHEQEGEHIIVVPNLALGNADMRHMHEITDNTFNFGGGRARGPQDLGPAHTVNEFISIDTHVSAAKFFFTLIRNYSEAEV